MNWVNIWHNTFVKFTCISSARINETFKDNCQNRQHSAYLCKCQVVNDVRPPCPFQFFDQHRNTASLWKFSNLEHWKIACKSTHQDNHPSKHQSSPRADDRDTRKWSRQTGLWCPSWVDTVERRTWTQTNLQVYLTTDLINFCYLLPYHWIASKVW